MQVEPALDRRPPMNAGKLSRRALIHGASIAAAGAVAAPVLAQDAAVGDQAGRQEGADQPVGQPVVLRQALARPAL